MTLWHVLFTVLFVIGAVSLASPRSRKWAKWVLACGIVGFIGAGTPISIESRTSGSKSQIAGPSEEEMRRSQMQRMVVARDILSRSAEQVVDAPAGAAPPVQPAPDWVRDWVGHTVRIYSDAPHPVGMGMKTIYMNVDGMEAVLVTAGGPYCRLREPAVGAMIKVPCSTLSR